MPQYRTEFPEAPLISGECRRRNSEAHKGKRHSEEYKRKMSELMKGEKHPMYGRYHTEEAKQKMSKAKKGKSLGQP